MLLPIEVDLVPKKESCKQNLVWPSGSSSGKVVLTVLAEVVALYVRPTAIDVRGLGLEFDSR